uniref:Uncharacterized protein n=1 Tax=Onchocerca volvulus TaxID=6282 RepID=A0A8R1TME0_ONCVO
MFCCIGRSSIHTYGQMAHICSKHNYMDNDAITGWIIFSNFQPQNIVEDNLSGSAAPATRNRPEIKRSSEGEIKARTSQFFWKFQITRALTNKNNVRQNLLKS